MVFVLFGTIGVTLMILNSKSDSPQNNFIFIHQIIYDFCHAFKMKV